MHKRSSSEPGRPRLARSRSAVTGHVGKSRRRSRRGSGEESNGRIVTREASNKADLKSVAETVERRRPAGGKVSSDACPGLRTGTGMSLKLGAYGSGVHGLPKLRTSPLPRVQDISSQRRCPPL